MSKQPVFITGNAHKAEHIANLLGLPIQHEALELDEIQAKSPEDVIRHKVMEAYEILQKQIGRAHV